MATLVMTVAGGLIGGPVGAAIGGMIGSTVDREVLFRPKGREGPRLSDLRVQTSSYGAQIPKLFGVMRVAGTVIWASDIVEHRASPSGGKGRPGTTGYSYAASFAVALSGRPILRVGRIWADGKLLRGAAGDFKVRTGFRLHQGSEAQEADPLIAAAEGLALAPAHRGMAYAVFEDLELAAYGNRIPSLTFEVVADEAALSVGAIATALAGPELTSEAGMPALTGFAAAGASVRAVVETLAGAAGAWFHARPDGLVMAAGSGAAAAIDDVGVGAGRGQDARAVRSIVAADQAADRLTLTYHDPARDYQTGVQRAGVAGAARRETRVELPAAATAQMAKGIAQAALTAMDLARERRTVCVPWSALAIAPGARVTIAGSGAGSGGAWRVDRWLLEDMVLRLECVRIAAAPLPVPASGGRAANAADLLAGETVVHAFELPLLGGLATVPRLGIAAAGSGAGWRGASLLLSTDGGSSWSEAGATSAPAVLGQVIDPPGPAPCTLADRVHRLTVRLAHDGMALSDADDAMLAAGANLALAGNELLQFGTAEPLGGGLWRLGTLWRGRRGTEWAAGLHSVGDRFVLLAKDAIAVRDLPISLVGGEARVLAQAAGDAEAASSQAAIRGRGMVPPSPVHVRAAVQGDGTTRLSWVRRSRLGWDWIDGVDVPLAEEQERYRVTISGAHGVRVEEPAVPELMLAAAERAAPLSIAIAQIGSNGASLPANIELPPIGESHDRS